MQLKMGSMNYCSNGAGLTVGQEEGTGNFTANDRGDTHVSE